MQKLFFYLLIVLSTVFNCLGQEIHFPDHKNISLKNIKPILQDGVVQGYYAPSYYRSLHGDSSDHYINVMDPNFKIIKEIRIGIRGTHYFNGSSFCYERANATKKTYWLSLINLEGIRIGDYYVEDLKLPQLYPTIAGSIYPIENTGFLRNGPNPDAKNYMELIGIDAKPKWKILPKTFPEEKGKMSGKEFHHFFAANEKILLVRVRPEVLPETELGDESRNFIRVYNVQTGEEMFSINEKEEPGIKFPHGAKLEQNQIIIYGQYIKEESVMGNHPFRTKDYGFYVQSFDLKGNILNSYVNDGGNEIWGHKLELASNYKEQAMLWLHNLESKPSGGYYIVGELFIDDGKPVRDMLVYELSDSLTLTDINTFKKLPKISFLPYSNAYNGYNLGITLFQNNQFDYRWSSRSVDDSYSGSVYINYDEADKSHLKYSIGILGFNRENVLVHKTIAFNPSPDELFVFPAKPGYIAVAEYFKDDKSGTFKWYKLDF